MRRIEVAGRRKPEDCRTVQLSLDRFEEGRDHSRIAVLMSGDGSPITVPHGLLPAGARPGDVLSVTFRRDPEATRHVADRTRAVQGELGSSDPGGDIQL